MLQDQIFDLNEKREKIGKYSIFISLSEEAFLNISSDLEKQIEKKIQIFEQINLRPDNKDKKIPNSV